MLFRPDKDDGVESPAQSGGTDVPAQLTMDQVIQSGHAMRLSRRPTFADRLATADLAPDLASNIGSARWWRGLGTMVALGALAISGWPDFAPVAAAPAMQLDEDARDEFRSQMIMPLALGADSGRRMGASALVSPLAAAPERPTMEIVATLAQGDSFERMLRRAGVGREEASRVAQMVSGQVALTEIEPGTKVDIVLGRRPQAGEPRALDNLAFRARFDLQMAVEREGGALKLRPKPIRVDSTPLRIRGTVGDSLYRSARAAGAPSAVVQAYLKTLSQQTSVESGIGAGDTFDMVVEYKRAETGEAEAGQLLYAGLERARGKDVQLLRWGADGKFYEASGVGEQRGGLVSPVPGRVTSRYGMRRHPVLGYRRMHAGLDFKAGYGTPIYAVTDGTVAYAGRRGGYGNYVKLNHGGGLATGYAHMSRFAVSSGTRVRRGQVIGYVGSTGLSTGPHLHYEMYRGGQKVDPASVRFVTRAQLSGSELAAFRSKLAEVKTVAPGAALTSLKPSGAAATEPVREIDRIAKPREIG